MPKQILKQKKTKKMQIIEPDIHYKVLDLIEENPKITQRELSKKLGVSLGSINFCMKALIELRKNNIKSELYPDSAKMKKQMNYANRREIPFVVLVASTEIENKNYTLKNMQTGEQQDCSLEELLKITT